MVALLGRCPLERARIHDISEGFYSIPNLSERQTFTSMRHYGCTASLEHLLAADQGFSSFLALAIAFPPEILPVSALSPALFHQSAMRSFDHPLAAWRGYFTVTC